MLEIIREGARRVGGLQKFGKLMGIKYQSFRNWTRVPAERARKFSDLTGIPLEDIRPDLWGDEK